MVLVDPDGYLEEFCCGVKSSHFKDPCPSGSSWNQSDRSSTESPFRTDSQPGYGDPGGGDGPGGTGTADKLHPPHLETKSVLDIKRTQQQHLGPSGGAANNSLNAPNSFPQGNRSPFAATSGGQTHYQVSHHVSSHPNQSHFTPQFTSPPHPDTDSALEAAVNSILEC